MAGHKFLVIDHQSGLVGSSAHALLNEQSYQDRFDQELYDQLGIANGSWFPAGLTAHHDVERVFTNHYVDVLTSSVSRFRFPTDDRISLDDAVREISYSIRQQYRAMVSSPQGMALTLTGGHDTRMLLACLGKLSSEIDCLTICPESSIHVDRVIPEQLSIQFGLRHVWVQPLAADNTGQDLFVRRSAHCYGDTNKIYFKTLAHI